MGAVVAVWRHVLYIARGPASARATLFNEENAYYGERTGEGSQDQKEAPQECATREKSREGEASGDQESETVGHYGEALSQRSFQVVFFDAAGTLFQVKGSVADIYLRHAERYGFKKTDASLSGIKEAFARAFHDAPPPVFAAAEPHEIKQCERLWWFDIVHTVFYRVGMFARFDEFFDDVFELFGRAEAWSLYPETLDVLKTLKGRGLELGIVSNFDSRLFPVLRELGLEGCFDTVTISSLAHAAKPSGRIFQEALEKHAADPGDALHVGDSLTDDVEGARQAGLTAVLLARGGEPTVHGVPTITRLDGLYPLLSRV
jgi:putative hydrolase of the HAD superfamily